MMSALHSRLPDTGSNGPGIHSSSKGSFCGDLKLSSIFEICVRPICHKLKHTSVRFGSTATSDPVRPNQGHSRAQRRRGPAATGAAKLSFR